MPIRFQTYRMRDGVTPLAEDYFNPVLAEIDARIAALEDQRADLQRVIDEVSAFGLQRIDVLIGPAVAELNAAMTEVVERRDQLVAAIGNLSDIVLRPELTSAISIEQAARQSAISIEQAARQSAISTEQAARQSAITAEQTARQHMDAQLLALVVAAL